MYSFIEVASVQYNDSQCFVFFFFNSWSPLFRSGRHNFVHRWTVSLFMLMVIFKIYELSRTLWVVENSSDSHSKSINKSHVFRYNSDHIWVKIAVKYYLEVLVRWSLVPCYIEPVIMESNVLRLTIDIINLLYKFPVVLQIKKNGACHGMEGQVIAVHE